MNIVLAPYHEVTFEGELPAHQLAAVHALYSHVGKTSAIKWLRAAYPGSGLGSTKKAIEELAANYGWPVPKQADEDKTLGDILAAALRA